MVAAEGTSAAALSRRCGKLDQARPGAEGSRGRAGRQHAVRRLWPAGHAAEQQPPAARGGARHGRRPVPARACRPAAALLDCEQAHVMGDGAGGAGLFVPRRDVPEGEAQGDGVAGEDKEHGRPWTSSPEKLPEKQKRKGNNQTVMYSRT